MNECHFYLSSKINANNIQNQNTKNVSNCIKKRIKSDQIPAKYM